ncbi:hypothetical protein [Actinomadura madurae]|uniref:hypothetical protein n=1 Tax=Actinomadura madurae TaxID=1993 RepID=UPI002026D5FD|nr:hypothetical protein [Actinomadura madurae]MCP9953570.1 hypothetical protein [Actinomadura madurae]MCP9970326.1 hypothetical protein [Actinomadura madurae]MCP9982803.1 hypothetical protein [Actinomadura madurae]MCQ0005648.1 hypothetical protein [Actinomadura madurae]MCQ0019039.1 hypothetical protein [Actinomadura madurae]
MLDVMITWTGDLVHGVTYMGPIPNPGEGEEPPFGQEIETLLKWGMWGALFCCVAGFIVIGARMGIQHKRGEAGGHMGSMAIVGFATVLIMTAYTIVERLAGSAG